MSMMFVKLVALLIISLNFGRGLEVREFPVNLIQDVKCPQNQIYHNDCAPNGCNTTCKFQIDLKNGLSSNCSKCLLGCWCVDGLYLDEDRNCVQLEKCFKEETTTTIKPSRVQEEYSPFKLLECPEKQMLYPSCTPSCVGTCEYIRFQYKKKLDQSYDVPFACSAICLRGCWCAEGFYKDFYGNCLTEEECLNADDPYMSYGPDIKFKPDSILTMLQQGCPEHEIFYHNCIPCKGSCRNLLSSSSNCSSICIRGCWCQPGLYRNNKGDCVSREKCLLDTSLEPVTVITSSSLLEDSTEPAIHSCPVNKTYYLNSTPCCTNNCNYVVNQILKSKGLNIKLDYDCDGGCVKGCWCREGLFDDDGQCVPREKCLEKLISLNKDTELHKKPDQDRPFTNNVTTVKPCPINQRYYAPIIPDCKKSCNYLKSIRGLVRGSYSCNMMHKNGCWCKEGFYQDDDGNCITEEKCLQVKQSDTTVRPNTYTRNIYAKCSSGEIYYQCLPACTRSCRYLRYKSDQDSISRIQGARPLPPYQCERKCQRGCWCNGVLYKNDDGNCVTKEECFRSWTRS